MITPPAYNVPGPDQAAAPATARFLRVLAGSIAARFAYYVPAEPHEPAVGSSPDQPFAPGVLSSLDGVARQWLAGTHGETVRLAVAGVGTVDIAVVRTVAGELRGALLVALALGSHPGADSATAELRLAAALMPSVLDSAPTAAARQALFDWASDQTGGRAAFAVSIDRLGVTNEVFGYPAGDAVLSTLVFRLEQWAGPAARITRVGGARYLAIRTDLLDRDDAMRAAGRLRELVAAPIEVDGLRLSRSASIGVAIDPDGSQTPEALVEKAVLAGAVARSAGGDEARGYDGVAATTRVSRLRLELELHDGLAAGQLRMHYQPEHDLRTGRIGAVEALLRWQHPRLGLLGADSFVPDSEQTHTFADVQRWVIDETCRQLAQWRRSGAADDLLMRVNVSARQIVHDDTTGFLIAALERYELRGEQVCVEITERHMPADLTLLATELVGLRARGVLVAVDDFGTGEGTLAHLLTLPIDVVKIDQTFVRHMTSDSRAAAIVAGVTSLARSLKLDVVAEGVDGPETAAALVRLGCERGQGNALAEAMPPDQLATLLRAQYGSGAM